MRPLDIKIDEENAHADLTLPKGACLVCGGELEVRATQNDAWAVCKPCGYFQRASVRHGPGTMEVAFLSLHA